MRNIWSGPATGGFDLNQFPVEAPPMYSNMPVLPPGQQAALGLGGGMPPGQQALGAGGMPPNAPAGGGDPFWHRLMNPLFLGGLGMLGNSMPGLPRGTSPFQGFMQGAGVGTQWGQNQEMMGMRREQAERQAQEFQQKQVMQAYEQQQVEAEQRAREGLAEKLRADGDMLGAAAVMAGEWNYPSERAPSLKAVMTADGPRYVTSEDALGRTPYSSPLVSVSMDDKAATAGAVRSAQENAVLQARQEHVKGKGAGFINSYRDAAHKAQGVGGVAVNPQTKVKAQIARTALIGYIAKNVLGTPGAEPSPRLYEEAAQMVPDFSGVYDSRVLDQALQAVQQAMDDALGATEAPDNWKAPWE